jgi:hypothetical protein
MQRIGVHAIRVLDGLGQARLLNEHVSPGIRVGVDDVHTGIPCLQHGVHGLDAAEIDQILVGEHQHGLRDVLTLKVVGKESRTLEHCEGRI